MVLSQSPAQTLQPIYRRAGPATNTGSGAEHRRQTPTRATHRTPGGQSQSNSAPRTDATRSREASRPILLPARAALGANEPSVPDTRAGSTLEEKGSACTSMSDTDLGWSSDRLERMSLVHSTAFRGEFREEVVRVAESVSKTTLSQVRRDFGIQAWDVDEVVAPGRC